LAQEKKLLITGGAGFIGSHIVANLAKNGYTIRVLDNLSSGKLSNIEPTLLSTGKVEFIKDDIRDPIPVKQAVKDIIAVFHLAAQISVPLSIQNPKINDDINICGTHNLLDASVNAGINKFIFISSCVIYGDPVYLPIDEMHPTSPISPYAQSKLMEEQMSLNLNNKRLLCSTVLRFFNVYGPRQGLNDYSGVITKFVDRIK
jgi:UDP-glucose 4-epimerase